MTYNASLVPLSNNWNFRNKWWSNTVSKLWFQKFLVQVFPHWLIMLEQNSIEISAPRLASSHASSVIIIAIFKKLKKERSEII